MNGSLALDAGRGLRVRWSKLHLFAYPSSEDHRRCSHPRDALEVLKKIVAVPGHHFWPDTVAPTDAVAFASAAFVGHRQVTDAYLLSLTQHHKGNWQPSTAVLPS